MGDQEQHHQKEPSNKGSETQKTETVRSRWTPKPEQILILETIFNSGMVNPPKEETVRIRKLLEKFGAVGDANVFYWFQNRRSRSRRRQRLIQASLNSEQAQSRNRSTGSTLIPKENGFLTGFTPPPASIPSPSVIVGSSSNSKIEDDENLMYFGNCCQQQNIDETSSGGGGGGSIFCDLDSRNSLNQYGIITVMINGVAMQVQRGPLDVRAMYGQDVMLYHSSGFPVAVNDYGILLEPLQHGESYFLGSLICQEAFARLVASSASKVRLEKEIADLEKMASDRQQKLKDVTKSKDQEIEALKERLQAQETELAALGAKYNASFNETEDKHLEEQTELENNIRRLRAEKTALEAAVPGQFEQAIWDYKASVELSWAMRTLLAPLVNHSYSLGVDDAKAQFLDLAVDSLAKKALYKDGMGLVYEARLKEFQERVDIMSKYATHRAAAPRRVPSVAARVVFVTSAELPREHDCGESYSCHRARAELNP